MATDYSSLTSLSNLDFKDFFSSQIRTLQARLRDINDLIANGENYTEAHQDEIKAKIRNYFVNEYWDVHENLPNTNLWTGRNER